MKAIPLQRAFQTKYSLIAIPWCDNDRKAGIPVANAVRHTNNRLHGEINPAFTSRNLISELTALTICTFHLVSPKMRLSIVASLHRAMRQPWWRDFAETCHLLHDEIPPISWHLEAQGIRIYQQLGDNELTPKKVPASTKTQFSIMADPDLFSSL